MSIRCKFGFHSNERITDMIPVACPKTSMEIGWDPMAGVRCRRCGRRALHYLRGQFSIWDGDEISREEAWKRVESAP